MVNVRKSELVMAQLRCLTALIGVALVIVGLGATRAQARAPAHGLDVQPFPGTPDASPQTDIGFPALAAAQIRALAVTGSRSGSHRVRLIALPPGHGTDFAPLRPFTDG